MKIGDRRNGPIKKKMLAVLAALMVLTVATPVLAAPSVTAEDVAAPVDAVVTVVNGQEVELTVEPVEEAVVETVYDKVETATTSSSTETHTVAAIVEVSLPAGVTMPAEGLAITFDVDGIVAGDHIYLLHQKADGTWETITPSKVADGKVTATFTSLSPVAIVKVVDEATSPKTGAPLAVAPIVALVCVAGTVGCARKMK